MECSLLRYYVAPSIIVMYVDCRYFYSLRIVRCNWNVFNRIIAECINTLTSFCWNKNIYHLPDQELIIISITKLILEAFYKTILQSEKPIPLLLSLSRFSLSMLQPNRKLTFQINVYVQNSHRRTSNVIKYNTNERRRSKKIITQKINHPLVIQRHTKDFLFIKMFNCWWFKGCVYIQPAFRWSRKC